MKFRGLSSASSRSLGFVVVFQGDSSQNLLGFVGFRVQFQRVFRELDGLGGETVRCKLREAYHGGRVLFVDFKGFLE